MMTSTVVDYISGLIITNGWKKSPSSLRLTPGELRTKIQKSGLFFSISTNLILLGFFKYFNFFIDSFTTALSSTGINSPLLEDMIYISLPLGISFYTFQSMSYTIDIYRGQTSATRNFLDFACYVTLFPQLVAGPIVRYTEVAEQLVSRSIDSDLVTKGIIRFTMGLGKKVFIANSVAITADAVFALSAGDLTTSTAWLGIICYTLQIYFDFSGYSDMAIGLGMMFGFRFPENFNYPYIAETIQDFWRRWHISLSSWFRDYLYIPLGGNRGGSVSTYFNLFMVFFLCGLWHGASWTFVAWGMYHGIFLVMERVGLSRILDLTPRFLRHVYTIVVVMIGWVLFRADNFNQAAYFIKAMFMPNVGVSSQHPIETFFQYDIFWAIVFGILLSAPVLPKLAQKKDGLEAQFSGLKLRIFTASWEISRFAFTLLLLFYVPCG